MGLPSELGAWEGPAAGGGRQRGRGWAAVIILPYVGLIGGAVALVSVDEQTFEGLWWLAPVAGLAYLCLLLATVGSLTLRRRRVRASAEELEALGATIREAMAAGEPGDRRHTVESLLDRLAEVRVVSRGLSDPQRAVLQATLDEAGAATVVERRLARARTRWRRAELLRTLGWLADERSIPVLEEALRADDPELAFVAGQALSDYGSAPACRGLLDALRAGRPSRAVVATLLESSRYAHWATLVAAVAADPDPEVRSWVAYLLGRSRQPAVAAWLYRLAQDSEPAVRASAAEALAAFPDERILRRLLADADWRVRANAAKAIGEAGGPAALAADLTPLLRDRYWAVRQKATISLKQLGAVSIEPLRPLLDDSDRFARNKAAEILIDVGYAASQIAALDGRSAELSNARQFLQRLARAEARATIRAGLDSTDVLIRDRLLEVLEAAGDPAGPE